LIERDWKTHWIAVALIACLGIALPAHVQAQSCPGQRDSFATTKIVGGAGAKLAHWPAQAALRFKDPTRAQVFYFCGGTAIAPTWILTAAHCFDDVKRSDAGAYVNVNQRGTLRGWRVEVVLGRDDLEAVTPAQVYEVKNVVIREGYTNAEAGNDIALINLKTPWTGPLARLSLSGSGDPADSTSYAAGFGALQSGAQPAWKRAKNGETIAVSSATLQEVTLPLVATPTCRAQYQAKPAYKSARIGPEQVCAGYERGRMDTCQGDSGGPLVLYDRNKCPTQIGVVSWGDGCAAEKAYGVYTRVSAYRDWILRHVPEASRAPEAQTSAGAAIADQALAMVLKELETALVSAKGRVRITVSSGKQVKLGGLFTFNVNSDVSGRLVLLDVNAVGEVVQIFPNVHVTSGDAKFIDKGKAVSIPDATNPAYRGLTGFRAVEPLGRGRLIAVVTPKDASIADIVEEPQRVTKGFAPEGAPVSYLMNLFQQLIAAASARGADARQWALGETTYEIVR
jgi:secreted trypsin-like serine protease